VTSWALVTGASSGIGRALAAELVDHGYSVVVAAEDDRIEEVAHELDRDGVRVVPAQVDLSSASEVELLCARVAELTPRLDVAALNAGVANGGRFVESDLDADLRLVDLNCRSTVHLAKRVLPAMVEAGSGRVLVTASVAAAAPGPYHATYAASKAFAHSFAVALRHELRGTGVTVTSLLPGPTDTEIFERGDLTGTRLDESEKADPADVASKAYQALLAGHTTVVTGGARNRAQVLLSRVLPDRVAAAVAGRMTEPGSADREDRDKGGSR
jgi:short-subunit dehydrogenase